jgi:hypothetical protein
MDFGLVERRRRAALPSVISLGYRVRKGFLTFGGVVQLKQNFNFFFKKKTNKQLCV